MRKALDLSPDFVQARYNLGVLLEEQGRLDDAMAAYRRVLDVDPRFGLAYENLGRLLSACQRPEEAAAVYRRWLEVDPQNPVATHMLAARTGEQVPDRASERYVEKLFDAFAPGFERTLTGLEYRAPELVAAALAKVTQRLPPGAVILDAGCGTGLSGERLRAFAGRLVGVDLSTGMLAKAREKALYDELEAGELTAFLRGRPDGFDVVAASDTFNYFGELAELFAAVGWGAPSIGVAGLHARGGGRGVRRGRPPTAGEWPLPTQRGLLARLPRRLGVRDPRVGDGVPAHGSRRARAGPLGDRNQGLHLSADHNPLIPDAGEPDRVPGAR